MNFGDSRVPQRVWNKITVDEFGHWQWTGAHSGHPQVRITLEPFVYRTVNVRRILFEIAHGAQPIEHVFGGCERGCVNPDHLISATYSELRTIQEATKPERTHCPHGHDLRVVGVYINNSGGRRSASRECRSCRHARTRRRHGEIRQQHVDRMDVDQQAQAAIRSDRSMRGWETRRRNQGS